MTTQNATDTAELGFDPEALHKKYLEERDKRLRDDGNAQYVDMTGEYGHFIDDPYVEPGFTREPVTEFVDVLVVGGGFAGLFAAGHLGMAGVKNFRVIEKAGDFGGTWYWNRYPGAACDVESYIYFPLLEEVGGMPTEKYAKAPEIFEHTRRLGRHFGLYDKTLFQTQVTELRWDEEIKRWVVKTNRDDTINARFVCLGSGPLNRPKLPGIPGIKTFKGHSFHTSRWDYAYTGGDSNGNLVGLKDKRVAIIGTGATAIQCIPHLGASAKALYVFQRTPSAVNVRNNKPTDPEWVKTLEAGWQEKRSVNFDSLIIGLPQEEDLVSDGWTEIWSKLFLMKKGEGGVEKSPAELEEDRQMADYLQMDSIRSRVASIVKDPKTAESLKPYYNLFCKRPCFHDDYLPTFNRDNVTLIDTNGRGVDRITENALIFDGKSYEVDCIIYATGFEVGAVAERGGFFNLIGRGGIRLSEAWSPGVRSLHGILVRDFPNLGIVNGFKHASATVNIPYLVGKQAEHFAKIVKKCLDEDIKAIEVSQPAEDEWKHQIKTKSYLNEKFTKECTPGYYNNEGKFDGTSIFANFYGGGPFEYMKILVDWRETNFYSDLEITR